MFIHKWMCINLANNPLHLILTDNIIPKKNRVIIRGVLYSCLNVWKYIIFTLHRLYYFIRTPPRIIETLEDRKIILGDVLIYHYDSYGERFYTRGSSFYFTYRVKLLDFPQIYTQSHIVQRSHDFRQLLRRFWTDFLLQRPFSIQILKAVQIFF